MKSMLDLEGLWDAEMHVLGGVGSFEYYGYVIRKPSVGTARLGGTAQPGGRLKGNRHSGTRVSRRKVYSGVEEDNNTPMGLALHQIMRYIRSQRGIWSGN
ncbi:hypothetical protein N657DRAFT_252860 [Parathielavia appendiculata]|uniref:Uncharacterized protein n=1 Tax=Parathielavia appendiculata TaxID=2587402 RepID=A0AAN6YZK7_9PEZI|nr:hypothetical protein N657DRAFT_252860 [Parathielavia appendiculata]